MEIHGEKTIISEEKSATNTSTNVYTVPAGKILYIDEVLLETENAVGGICKVESQTAGSVRKRGLGSIRNIAASPSTSIQSLFPSFIKLVATEKVVVTSDTAGLTATAAISGFLVNA